MCLQPVNTHSVDGGSHLLFRARGDMLEHLGPLPAFMGKLNASVQVPPDMSPEVPALLS